MSSLNTDFSFQPTCGSTIYLPDSLLRILSPNRKKLLEALAANPHGLLSSELTEQTGISNKSAIIHFKLRMLLATYGLEVCVKRVSSQWLWVLCLKNKK